MLKNFHNKKSLAVIFMTVFATVFLVQAIAATALFLLPAPAQADCGGLADCGNGNGGTVACPTTAPAACTDATPCCLLDNPSTCAAWFPNTTAGDRCQSSNNQSGNSSSQTAAGSDGTCTCNDGSVPSDQVAQTDCDPNNADNPCFACSDPGPGCSWQASANSVPASAANFPAAASAPAKAYPPLKLQVPIPTFISGGETTFTTQITFDQTTRPIAQYIMLIYTYAVSAVGIVAAVVLMIGGLMWITAGGNTTNIGEAKKMITASLTGLVLVLTSYLILNQVNPALVNLQPSPIVKRATQTKTGPGITAPDLTKCTWTPQNSNNVNQTTGKTIPCPTGLFESPLDLTTNTTPGCTNPPPVLNNCCCQPLASGSCPVGTTVACQACPDCVLLSGQSGLDQVTCKSNNTCEVVPAMLEKLQTVSAALQGQNITIQVTEAWPPTVTHKAAGHQNGNCIDLVPDSRTTDKTDIEAIFSALKSAGFTTYNYECFSGDHNCSCNNYSDIPGSHCGATETGEAAGGLNHFHVCDI